MLSVAIQVTIVVPKGKSEGALLLIDDIPLRSSTSGSPSVTIFPIWPVASCVMSAGTTKFGAVVSTTVTLCVAVELFPLPSTANHVTRVVPSGNTDGASLVTVTVCTSVTFGATRSTGVDEDTASTTISSGCTIVGLVVSTTFTFCVSVARFPTTSIALHVIVVSPSGNTDGASLVMDAISLLSETVGSPRFT